MENEKAFLENLVKNAGELAKTYFKNKNFNVERKSEKDYVTEADKNVEQFIIEKITHQFPEDSIFGEEFGKKEGNHREWIIDPIDGTSSFVNDQPFFSTSIALCIHGTSVLGAVYAPILDELFIALKGNGAYLNGKKIQVSSCDKLNQAIFATGFACIRDNLKLNNLPFLNNILPNIRDIRRFGSAAMDLCYVACGRLDAYWELNLQPYDIAAGKIIVEEAGGIFSDFEDSNRNNVLEKDIWASNGILHQAGSLLLTEVKNAYKDKAK